MLLRFFSLLLCWIIFQNPTRALGAFGQVCTEAFMRFRHHVDTTDKIRNDHRAAKEIIEAQLAFLYGSMASDDYKGVPRGDHWTRISRIEPLTGGVSRIHYNYGGTILLQKGPRKYDTFFMPRDPSEKGIYDPAIHPKTGIVTATDDHYQGFGDYWYFWEPQKKGSLLKLGVHYDEVKAGIQRLGNTRRTYPEYERLVEKKTGTIPISMFYGMDNPDHTRNAFKGREVGANGYRGMRAGLLEMDFKKVENDNDQLRQKLQLMRVPHSKFTFEQFEKQTLQGKILVNMFYGPTGIWENSRAFHFLYKDALENSSIVAYDGHSGLGDHLDLNLIEEKEKFDIIEHPKRYQILFFNSCTSYSYYNIPYRILKGKRYGTKSLDILTNGLATYFDNQQHANLALVRAVDRWARGGRKESYQSLAKKMEQLGHSEETNLFSISGDHDNPTRP